MSQQVARSQTAAERLELGDTAGVDPKDISVAVMYPGGRIDRITTPLETTGMDVEVEPGDAYERDIILLDCPDRHIWKPLIRTRNRDAKVVYRIRGDMLRAFLEMNATPFKHYVSKYFIGKADAAVTIEPVLGERFERVTGVAPVGIASLCKRPDEWPTVRHTDGELRCITLTNANYLGKVQPIIEYAAHVERVLSAVGGYWNVYGRGKRSGYLSDCLAGFDHVHYKGHTDSPQGRLAQSNLMLHFSQFDSLPNAILEGMASGLPVITNPYEVFSRYGDPLIITSANDVEGVLNEATDPSWRRSKARLGMENVIAMHNPERVGRQYEHFFQQLLK